MTTLTVTRSTQPAGTSRLVYSTTTGAPDHADAVARIHAASVRPPQPVDTGLTCPTGTPELHGWGEFPMTCYSCHIAADS